MIPFNFRSTHTAFATLALTCGMAIILGLVFIYPKPAQACGGTFCDGVMPVDQTGENILFVMDEQRTEAHIQIQYDPESGAEKFAWIVPVTAVPTFKVGSQALFENLLNGSVPSYGFDRVFDSCGNPSPANDGINSAEDENGDDGGDKSSGPQVLVKTSVGAFDVVVLSGGTSMEVMQWLQTEGYDQDPAAEPILAEYLAQGFMFAAFKLSNRAGLSEIHPVVLSFDVAEACVPIRLTRIAAQENMEIRTFFLAKHRVVPRNYRHVQVNPLLIDWLNGASNYRDVITRAVDAQHADGRAFVTEYAGPSEIITRDNLVNDRWSSEAFLNIEASQVITALQEQNFLECEEEEGCEYYHDLILGILQRYLPVPAGLTEKQFYGCLSCYEEQIDQEIWDAEAFSGTMQERIIAPAMHAQTILQQWPYLTRMYTTISPAEMTEDPLFYENPDLAEVPNIRRGEWRFLCDGNGVFTLPDGREVYLPNNGSWPEFPDEMPWAEDVEAMLPSGQPRNLLDNSAKIDTLLAEYNTAHRWPRSHGCGCRVNKESAWLGMFSLFGLFGGWGVLRLRRRN